MSERVEIFLKRLESACAAARAQGLRIVRGVSGGREAGSCCPLRATVLDRGGWLPVAALLLGISEDEAWSFISGFDGVSADFYPNHENVPEFREAGRELARRLGLVAEVLS